MLQKLVINWKIKGALSAMYAFFAINVFEHYSPAYTIFFFIYLVDVVTGIIKALAKDEFSLAGLQRGFGKWLGYSIIVFVLLLMSGAFPQDDFRNTVTRYLVDWTLFYLMYQEYSSICENLEVFGLKPPNLTMLDRFIKKVKGLGSVS